MQRLLVAVGGTVMHIHVGWLIRGHDNGDGGRGGQGEGVVLGVVGGPVVASLG